MRKDFKKLTNDTIIYGVSNMTGRFLNWLLMPFYIRTLIPEHYGIIVHIYGLIAVLLVVFTYGMETGFFRYARKNNHQDVYRSILNLLAVTSFGLIVLMAFFSKSIANIFYDGQFSQSVFIAGIIVAIDSFLSVPFANLRYKNKALKFGILKVSGIFINILFNVLFLVLIPQLIEKNLVSESFSIFYSRKSGVFFVMLSNLISSLFLFFIFLPEILKIQGSFNLTIVAKVWKFSWPLLVVGITGMITQNSDKILMPILIEEEALTELAVYGANFKIGVLMTLFTQSFRFAFEPYFFKERVKGIKSYGLIMEYYIVFGIVIFLAVTLFIDLINILLTVEYVRGNIVIPFILIGQLFYGIYFNLSLWYKLTDKTHYGVYFGLIGMFVTVGLNVLLIPKMGMLGAGIALLIGYLFMVGFSYHYGNKFFPIPYPLKRISFYFILGFTLYFISNFISFNSLIVNYLFKALIFAVYIGSFFILNRRQLFIKENDKN